VPDGFHTVIIWVALATTAAVCGFFLRAFWNFLAIPELRSRSDDRTPNCMVVIPARDEETYIARAVSSLPHDSVIVVDDHSSDRTAEAARKAGAGVLIAPDLTAGALGKSNACMAGARLLQSR
jgi:cellulose synthase/poly-beta-1,6-N-acetylglucosamine synthase-like glycosyltransferase